MSETPEFLEALYGDPLREETQRTGRYLFIVSLICVAVVLFHVKFQPTNLFPLNFGEHTEVLTMLLSAGVLLLLISFVLRAANDVFRDWETELLITRYISNEQLKASEAAAREVEESMFGGRDDEEYESEPDPWWDSHYAVKEAADAAVKRAEDRIGIRRLPRSVRSIRKWLEIGVPVLFAVIALILSRSALGSFLIDLVFSLTPAFLLSQH